MATKLNLTEESINDLIKQYGSPLQIYDQSMIEQNSKIFLRTFEKLFPGFKQFFAIKALSNPTILQILLDIGMGLDASSRSELYISRKLNAQHIMYTSNFTSSDDMKYALDTPNCIINFDDEDGLENLLQVGKIPDLFCARLNPNIGSTCSETLSNVLGGRDSKFGMSFDKIIILYQTAKDLGATRFGLHVMTGSCILDINYFVDLVDEIFRSLNEIKQKVGIEMEFINMGGGIGIPYRKEEKDIDISLLAQSLRDAFDRNLLKYNLKEPTLFLECGRYVVGKFGWLISKCQSIKVTDEIKFYGLDACTSSNLMRICMYQAHHEISVLTEEEQPKSTYVLANVVGTLCENNDWFAKQRLLPSNIKKGDIFIIHNAGAHAIEMSNSYNGKLKAPELLIHNDNTIKLIRKANTIESLFANCV